MANITKMGKVLAAASVAAGLLAACNDDNGTTTVPARPPQSSTISFTIFVHQAFSNSANSPPVPLNTLAFNFDANDDPTAFNDLIAQGMF